MTTEDIRGNVKGYILKNFLFTQKDSVDNDQSLLRTGVIDSTGILELIAFVEEAFGVHFDDTELVADNFDTINRVAATVSRKKNPAASQDPGIIPSSPTSFDTGSPMLPATGQM
jgi:acyl carrier protein